MRKILLAGVAALFVTSCQAPLRTAHAGDALICGQEQGTCRPYKEHLIGEKPQYKEQKLPEWYVCYRVQETPSSDWYQGCKNWRYLAMYEQPKPKSKIIWKLRIEETIYTDQSLWNEDDYYFRKNWVRVKWTDNANRETFPDKNGWVYRKYLKEISCDSMNKPIETPSVIPGFPPSIPRDP